MRCPSIIWFCLFLYVEAFGNTENGFTVFVNGEPAKIWNGKTCKFSVNNFEEFKGKLLEFKGSYQPNLNFYLIFKLPNYSNANNLSDWNAEYVSLADQNLSSTNPTDNPVTSHSGEAIIDLGFGTSVFDGNENFEFPACYFPLCNSFTGIINLEFKIGVKIEGLYGLANLPFPRDKIFEISSVEFSPVVLNPEILLDRPEPEIAASPNQVLPYFQFSVTNSTWNIISVTGTNNYTFNSNQLKFEEQKCGRYHYSVHFSYTPNCPSGHTYDLVKVFDFDMNANPAFLSPSTIPHDKSFFISNSTEGVAYQWLKQSSDNPDHWDYLFTSEQGGIKESNNYKIRNFPLVQGCGNLESNSFSLGPGEKGAINTLQTEIFNLGIKSVADLSNPELKIGKDYAQSISYSDALGRPVYSAAISAGSGGEDIARHFEYDEWGREKKSFLPFATIQTTPGNQDANAAQNQLSFYTSHSHVAHDAKPYTTTTFDDDKDLSKVLKVFGIGQAWLSADKFSSRDGYLYKASDFTANPVYRLIWGVPGNGWAEKALTDNNDPNHQTYWDQELMVKESRSEDGQYSYEFINHLGQTVATRLMPRNVNPAENPLTTYFVYDDFGRLRIKIPPKVSNHFGNTASILYSGNNFLQLAPDLSSQMGPLVIALCTRYEYDNLGRLITEYKPGGGYVETVYDLLNRPIMSQDQSQRLNEANKWSFVKYDRMGRKVMTGEINFPGIANKTRNNLQTDADDANSWFEKPADDQNAMQGYSNLAFPVLDTEISTILTVDYFDGYDFKRGNEASANPFNPAADLEWNTTVLGAQPNLCADLQGLQTGHKVRVLGTENPGQWLMDVMVYDDRERLIATGSDNAFGPDGLGDEDWNYSVFDPVYGRLEKSYSKHHNLSVNAEFPELVATLKNYSYTNRNQLEKISMIINGGRETELVAYDYDVFGNVRTKHLCNQLQHLDLKHDIRGRLKQINNPKQIGLSPGSAGTLPADADIFGMALIRENLVAEGGAHDQSAEARFDGTITGQQWTSLSDEVRRSFTYKYDGFNRVNQAKYKAKENTWGVQWGQTETELFTFNEAEYDENGNITLLKQNGPKSKTESKTQVLVDDLDYFYESLQGESPTTNKLERVKENSVETYFPSAPGERDFRRDFNSLQAEYTYDAAGRLIGDIGKGISSIVYNILDLPEEIVFQSGSKIKTLYAADGRKLKYSYTKPSFVWGNEEEAIDTWYAAGFQYRITNSTNTTLIKPNLLFCNTEVGKAVFMTQIQQGNGNDAYPWMHQYHIYDHQGNLRIAFQEAYTQSEYGAGMEQINAQQEEQEFSFVAETRAEDVQHSRTGNYLSMLNPLTGKPIGPMKWVAVQKGDTVRIEAFAHYEAMLVNQTSTWQQGLAGFLIGSLANSIYSPTLENGLPNPAYQQLLLLGSTLAAMGIGNLTQPDPTVPRAYLKYIHYDQDSQFVSMGHMPISDEANEGYQQLLLQLVAQEDGFVQFFVANETLRDVYFDDITGMVRRPKIIQEGHYNPFGLPLAGLTTLGNPEYAYFFTGKELYEDEALQWYDYGARMYDAQIGRWTTHDPLYQMHTPYGYCGNNAVNFSDPDGRWFGWDDLAAAGIGFAIGYVSSGLTTGDWGKKSLIAGAQGAVFGWLAYNTGGFSAGTTKGTWAASNLLKFGVNMAAAEATKGINVNIPLGDNLTLSVNPSLAFGSKGLGIGGNFGLTYHNDGFSVGLNYGVTEYSNYGTTGKSLLEQRFGGGISYRTKSGFSVGAYSSAFKGGEFSQRVGGVQIGYKDVSFRTENDFIKGLGDGGDRFRSASGSIAYKDYSLNLRLFTGDPGKGKTKMGEGTRRTSNEGGEKGTYIKGSNGEDPDKYRAGILTLGYRGQELGADYDDIRHGFQNKLIHDNLLDWFGDASPWFSRMHYSNEGFYSGYSTPNPFTLW